MCKAPRALLKAGAVCPQIMATRSIIAGSAAATFELKALMATGRSRHCLMHHFVNVILFIDDGVLSFAAKARAVMSFAKSSVLRDMAGVLDSEELVGLDVAKFGFLLGTFFLTSPQFCR